MGVNFLNFLPSDAKAFMRECGEPEYRGNQLYKWIQKGTPVSEMTTFSEALRKKIAERGDVYLPKIRKKLVSQIDGTVKYLFELTDGQLIESVVMSYEHGNTICVSSQVGCRMGCRFCASTLEGLIRNLDSGEILGQVIAAQNDTGKRISNIVMMGIGEPFDNYDNVLRFVYLVNEKEGLNIGQRHISISTCGLAGKINQLADEDLQITLSISLHSVNNEERKKIMPITNRYSVDELLMACRDYFRKTGRRISFEYTLISGENDSEQQASDLAAKLHEYFGRSMPFHVNLIPLNEVAERKFKRGDGASVEKFRRKLESLGVNATVRRRLGPDINASCGQLRLNEKAN